MKLGTLVTTPDGITGTINRVSDRTGCRMYRVVDASNHERWFEAALLERA